MNLKIGQELWFVPADSRYRDQAMACRITAIGRRWAQVDRHIGRIDIETGHVDGGRYNSPGRCWPSKEAWEGENRKLLAWGALRDKMYTHFTPPDGVSHDDIVRANAMLGFAPTR